MKKLMLGTAMAALLGTSAYAQDLFRTEMDPAVAIAASDFIGQRVYAAETAIDGNEYEGVQEGWNDIGEINDVIINRDGKIDAVLVDVGGFLGMGERQVAVGMENIQFVSDSATGDNMNDYFLVINADRTALEGAPEYMRTGAMPNSDGTTNADATVNDDSSTATNGEGTATDNGDGSVSTNSDGTVTGNADGTASTSTDGTAMTGDTAATDGTTTAPLAGGTANTDNQTAATDSTAAPAATGEAAAGEDYAAVDATGITAEQLQGVRVYGPNDDDLGEISDLVLDDAGAPAKVIVDVGGFLGIGEKPVSIEMSQLELRKASNGDMLRAYVSMTQEDLEALPEAEL